MKFYRNKKKRKSRDTGTDDRHNRYSESMTLRLTTHGRSWKLYSECKELMLGIPPYWNPNRIFFQSSQASFTLCRINRKSGLKDLKQTKQFIRHTELSSDTESTSHKTWPADVYLLLAIGLIIYLLNYAIFMRFSIQCTPNSF